MKKTVALNSEHVDTRWFYVWMAGARALIAFSGFRFTYLAPVASRSFDGAPVLHLHGLLFFSWTLLFVVQTTLAATSYEANVCRISVVLLRAMKLFFLFAPEA